jgi:hypothetical protein
MQILLTKVEFRICLPLFNLNCTVINSVLSCYCSSSFKTTFRFCWVYMCSHGYLLKKIYKIPGFPCDKDHICISWTSLTWSKASSYSSNSFMSIPVGEPSMSTRMQSLTTLTVVNITIIAKSIVHIGSTICQVGWHLITIAAITTPTD